MTKHVVVGTAGHVDHGKTALVRSLTGTETDRWQEEKRRGITIDLGFARLPLADDLVASIVDVPGHEDFVRNMVAGATGIDIALLVVAADEGVMPQTVEHLAILEFLGVRSGVLVVSKVDLVEGDWLELVVTDVTERVRKSPVRWEAPVEFSAHSGQGVDELKDALVRAAGRAVQRSADDLFRMPVDRVFSAPGAGTVVTGTTWSGTVATGDGVRLLPGTEQARVRSVEVHGERRERAEPGRRTALALPGVARETISRGSVVVADPGWQDSKAVDVLVTLLPDARPLSQRTRIRLHLGTSEVFARVTPATDEIVPGKTAAARLRLEQPVVARWGDRGVLRSYSPVRTIGGCVVIDPHPPRRPRRPQGLHDRAVSNPAARVARFTALSDWEGLPIRDLPVRAGVHPTEVSEVVQEARAGDIEVVSEKLFPKVLLREARRITTEALEAYHHDRPLDPGMQRELLRGLLPNPALIDYVVAALVGQGKVVVEAGAVRLSTHEPTLSDQERQWVGAMSQALEEAGPLGRTEQELGEVVPSTAVRDLAEYLVREGAAVRIGRDRFYRTEAARTLREAILEELRERGRATPAELRVKTGLTRKYLIPFLEWLDGAGFTVRDGDGRRLGPAADARDLDS